MLAWLSFIASLVMGKVCYYSLFLGENHAQLKGFNVSERLKSTLAYGWVEHCSDIAGCGTSFLVVGRASFKDKYSCVFKSCNCIFLWIIMKLSWTCWMHECVASAIYIMYIPLCISLYLWMFYFKAIFYIMFMGLIFPWLIDVFVSSPPSKGCGCDSVGSECWL